MHVGLVREPILGDPRFGEGSCLGAGFQVCLAKRCMCTRLFCRELLWRELLTCRVPTKVPGQHRLNQWSAAWAASSLFAGLHGKCAPLALCRSADLGDEHTLALCSGQVAAVVTRSVRSAQALELRCSELQLTEKWNPAVAADVVEGGSYSAARGLLDLATAATALQVPRLHAKQQGCCIDQTKQI